MGRGRSRIAVVTLSDEPGPAAAAPAAAGSKRPRGAQCPTNTAAVDAAVGSAASPVLTPPEREGRARSAKKRRRAAKAACLWCYKEVRGSAGVGALC
jgi:hypothetical protein